MTTKYHYANQMTMFKTRTHTHTILINTQMLSKVAIVTPFKTIFGAQVCSSISTKEIDRLTMHYCAEEFLQLTQSRY